MRPTIRNPALLGLCPVRELIREACPDSNAAERPVSAIDIDVVLRNRVDRWDWFGRLRLIEVQRGQRLAPAKAIAYASIDYAYRHSPLAGIYDGVFVVHGYAALEHPDEHDLDVVDQWRRDTFAAGVCVNDVELEFNEFVAWLRDAGAIPIPPLEFAVEHRRLERAVE